MKIKIEGKTIEGSPCWEIWHENGWMMGCHSEKENKLYVWAVQSEKKGTFKEMMNCLVDHFGTNKIEFTNILNDNLFKVLKDFKPKEVYWERIGESILCLEGEWKK